MSYICKDCKNNNHGWCLKKKINGLKRLNVEQCDFHNPQGTNVRIVKSIDGIGEPSLSIFINDEGAFIPVKIVEEFLKGNAQNIKINIPE
ncbi:hypothetical protein [Clostridium sp. ZBS3]|uniref:hypothetical protein n=1 Tax=Clostridium sp. ZBS3 TaxID=2949975 RepID=UPI00207AFBFF|nr:hypothetical protein [Clostridium sp. ZBS3]